MYDPTESTQLFGQAMQQVLSSLAPEIQGLAPIQSLFNAPLTTVPYSSGGPPTSWYSSAQNPNFSGGLGGLTGVNDPTINAAIQALTQYIQGGGAPTPTPTGGTQPSAT